ncbi:MAG: hypothetical protein J4G18_09115 [Anaerolineae bacterium]|nr:hypothetical protein [Anaerolineae bacterium]
MLKKLGKTYRKAADDVEQLIDELESGKNPVSGSKALQAKKSTKLDCQILRPVKGKVAASGLNITSGLTRYGYS